MLLLRPHGGGSAPHPGDGGGLSVHSVLLPVVALPSWKRRCKDGTQGISGLLARLEKLMQTRHSWTSSRAARVGGGALLALAMLAILLRDAKPEVDMDKVLRMPHPRRWGRRSPETSPPSRRPTPTRKPSARPSQSCSPLPDGCGGADRPLCRDGRPGTPEARVYKALDKLEVVVQHNEAPLTPGCPWSTSSTRPMAFLETAPSRPGDLREQARLIPWAAGRKPGGCASAGFRAIPLRRRAAAACLVSSTAFSSTGPRAAPPLQLPDCHTGSRG